MTFEMEDAYGDTLGTTLNQFKVNILSFQKEFW